LLSATFGVFALCVGEAAAQTSPAVSTGRAISISSTRESLGGAVNPNGLATQYWFVWGPTTAYGGTTAHVNAGAGTRTVQVRLTATGLLPGTVYHWKMFAQNSAGTVGSADHTFKTSGHALPGVITTAVTNVSAFGATFNATVVPNGQTTTWTFQYSGGGPFSTTSEGAVSGKSGPTNVSQTLFPLVPGTTYMYRLLGTHAGFPTSYGPFVSFSTFPTARPYPPRFTASTTPSRVRTKPFTFTTTGSLTPSSKWVVTPQCAGIVFVRYFIGNRQVSLSQVAIQSNCSYLSPVSFNHTFAFKVGGPRPSTEQLRVETRFSGNDYIAPTAKARVGHVTLG
jgi:hypothetical protein